MIHRSPWGFCKSYACSITSLVPSLCLLSSALYLDKYFRGLYYLRLGTNMHGKLQKNLNTESFIVDRLNLCPVFIKNYWDTFHTYPICCVKSYVECLSKDTYPLYTKLLGGYFVLPLDRLPFKGSIYSVFTIHMQAYIRLCIAPGYLRQIHLSTYFSLSVPYRIVVRRLEML